MATRLTANTVAHPPRFAMHPLPQGERGRAYNARTCQNRSVRRAFSDVIRA